jgi:glutathione S-transferase
MLPTDQRAQADALRWLMWEGIHLNKALGTIFFEALVWPQLGWGATNQPLVDDALQQAERYLAVLDAHLGERRFMLGDALSFVDFAIASAEPYRAGFRSISAASPMFSGTMISSPSCRHGSAHWARCRRRSRPERLRDNHLTG